MQSFILIVNKNGLLSAMPSVEEYNTGAYFSDKQMVDLAEVQAKDHVHQHIWEHRDYAFIIGPGYPIESADQIVDVNKFYYQVIGGELHFVDIPASIVEEQRFEERLQNELAMQVAFSQTPK